MCSGFVLFVACLKKDYYSVQFSMVRNRNTSPPPPPPPTHTHTHTNHPLRSLQFGWTHLTMFMLGSQAYLIIQNVFEALFWFLLPVSMVICNDIMAYIFGENVTAILYQLQPFSKRTTHTHTHTHTHTRSNNSLSLRAQKYIQRKRSRCNS